MNKNAILGYTGFVGSNLKNKIKNSDLYNSKNLNQIESKEYENIFCCCIPGTKYLANKFPEEDLNNIIKILRILKNVKCKNFYLISSQDCNSSLSSNEIFTNLPPTDYGKNRLYFENCVKDLFNCYTIRLGCLFGKNLKKNIIFDLLNKNYIENIKEDFTLQIYDLNDLVSDLQKIQKLNLHLVNIFSEPIWISEIIEIFNDYGYSYSFNIKKNLNKCYQNKGLLYKKEIQLQKLRDFIDENRIK